MMDRRDNPPRQALPDLPDETLFDDPMMPSASGVGRGAATTGTGIMGAPVGSAVGADRTGGDPSGEGAFRDSLSGGSGADTGSSDDAGSMPDASDAVSAVKSGGGRAMGWIQEHPLTAVGLGLIGGIVLGARGGGERHHHHHYGSQESSDGGGQSGQSGQSGQQGKPGGLAGLIQQTGLMDSVTSVAERAVHVVNEQATDMLRQRVPGFEDQLQQKRGPSAPAAKEVSRDTDRAT